MPGHDVHLYVDTIFFGRTYPRIHYEMDKMVSYYGYNHRIFFHDEVWARDIALREYPGDLYAILSAWLHILTDNLCTEDPQFRKLLEVRVELAKEERKQAKTLRKQLYKEIKEVALRRKRRNGKTWARY